MAQRKSARAPSARKRQGSPARSAQRSEAPWLPLALVLAAVASALLVWMISRFWPFTIDDTYITLRYSANLAAGHGPVYNPEPPRAEGYTSVLWMLALALPHLVKLDAVAVAKGLGVLLMAGTLVMACLLAARLSAFLGRQARWVPAAMTGFWLAAYHPTSVHAVSGMETALAAFLLTLLVYCAAFGRGDRVLVLLPTLGLLLGLTRPEANPLVAIILFTWCFRSAPAERRLRFALCTLGLYLLPGAIYFGWRAHYFGHLFPIPFYLKVASQGPLAGSDTVLSFLGRLLLVAGLPLAGCLLRWNGKTLPEGGGSTESRTSGQAVLWVAGVASLWIGLCLFPANIMDYEARFCFPAAPLLFALAGYGLAVWLSRLRALLVARGAPGYGLSVAAVVAAVALASWLGLSQRHAWVVFDRSSYGMALKQTHVHLGKVLAGFPGAREQRPLLAIGDAGAVPYYSGWRTLDSFGLNDPVIGIEGNRSPSYVLEQSPALVVLVSREQLKYRTHDTMPWEGRLFEAVSAAGMTRIAVMSFSPRSHLWVMGDPQSEVARYLGREMRKLMEERGGRARLLEVDP